jgi:hypothetical protein
MHCAAPLSLEASTLTSISTIRLITGARVYNLYPPMLHNMTTVQTYLLDLTKNLTSKHENVRKTLQDGMTFAQRAGQTVTIPP